MDMLVVQGGRPLSGAVSVDGSKNATLPIMAATLLTDGPVRLRGVPALADVDTMARLLRSLGADVIRSGSQMVIDPRPASGIVAEYDLVRRMRAGVCVLGPLLARCGTAQVSLPGGCNIGHRPIDLHLRGLAALGADIRICGGYVVAEAGTLTGARIDLTGPQGSSVTATCNVMSAAVAARGETVILGAAQEPEVVCLGRFLNDCGAKISGLGSPIVTVDGVERLATADVDIGADRIEAATLAVSAALTRSRIRIDNAPVSQMDAVLSRLADMGVDCFAGGDGLTVDARHGRLRPVNLVTSPYPGIPTDTQAQFTALLTTVPGTSVVTDRVFPERFMHVSELIRMGARIRRAGNSAVIEGVPHLSGAPLMASDLRASAALLLAAVSAEGDSQIRRIYHLDRGYVRLEEKLNRLGATIQRCQDIPARSVSENTRSGE